jgi:AraC family transcriptional regulator
MHKPTLGADTELYTQRIDQTIAYISQHLSEAMNLDTVASVSGFSPFHFHRIFKAMTGETPQSYINRLRLEKAANLLVKSPVARITEIAFKCGFSSSAVFARSFKKYYGISASDYAKSDDLKRMALHPATGISTEALPESFALPEITIQSMPVYHLAYFATHHGYGPESVGKAWAQLFEWAQAKSLLSPQTNLVGICYDDPDITPLDKCRYYACIPAPDSLKKDRRAGFMDLPGGLRAMCRVEGDQQLIQATFRALYRQWLPHSGFLPDDMPPYEVYYYALEAYQAGKYVLDVCIPIQME